MAFSDFGGFDFHGISSRPDALWIKTLFRCEKPYLGLPNDSPGEICQHVDEAVRNPVIWRGYAPENPMASPLGCQETPHRHKGFLRINPTI
jgi:hypothetical protein